MRSWLREDVLRRVLKNSALLGSGKAAGAVLHLAGLALSARLLGPAAFGLLIIVRSYAQAISGIAKFQSWQALIRFGTVRAESGDREGFRDLVGFTIAVDAVTGLVAMVVAIVLVPWLGPWLGMSAETTYLVQIYCLVIPLTASATPTGVLRIFDRFDYLSWQSLVTPVVRLGGILIGALFGAPLWALVIAWMLSDMMGELFVWVHAAREMKRKSLIGGTAPSPRRAVAANPGLIRFSLASNGSATLTHALAPLLTLFVASLLGPAAAGLYRLVQVVLDAAATPGDIAMRSLFPELARLVDSDPNHFWRLIIRASAILASLGALLALILAVVGPWLFPLAVGPGYAAAGPVLATISFSLLPIIAALPLETALLALGMAGRLLLVRSIAAAVIFGLAALLAARWQLPGVGLAVTIGAIVAFSGMLLILLKYRERGGQSTAA